MSINIMRDEIKTFLEEELKEIRLLNGNNVLSGLNIYKQKLPARKAKKDEELYPFVLIKVTSFKEESAEDELDVTVHFIIGTHDEADNMEGDDDVINVLFTIYSKMRIKGLIGKKTSVINKKIEAKLIDDLAYSKYAGALEMHFNVPKPQFVDENI